MFSNRIFGFILSTITYLETVFFPSNRPTDGLQVRFQPR